LNGIEILGCRVDAVGREAAVERVVVLARGSTPSLVVTLGTEMVMEAQHNERFRAALASAALVTCDTVGVLLASRLRGGPLRERVTGVELVRGLAQRSQSDGLRLYLLGGRDDTASRAAAVLRNAGAHVVGARDGYWPPGSDAGVAADVRKTGANLLLAALGSPKQELWLSQYLGATGCAVGIGIGGTLDVLAGNVARAPLLWQRLGLEWLYRLVREPWRWRRQLALPAFLVLALFETVHSHFRTGKTTG
jgi:N-acetylglucosaminyldiphosphoundecaprenol N-acetyl-beta-D-mannosaminyltransferase